jgi:predicted outer membrane protein
VLMMKHLTLAATLVAASLIAGPAVAGDENKADKQSKADKEMKAERAASDPKSFIKHAGEGGIAEVQLGQLAAERAQSPEVKQFAQKLVQDHTQANQQLQQIAQQKSVELSREVTGKNKEALDKFRSLSGQEFDREFLKHQAKHHEKDIRTFEQVANTSTDQEVKQFAQQVLPVLRQHHQTVTQLAQQHGIALETTDPSGQRFHPTGEYQTGQQPGQMGQQPGQPGQQPATAPGTTIDSRTNTEGSPQPGATTQPNM